MDNLSVLYFGKERKSEGSGVGGGGGGLIKGAAARRLSNLDTIPP